MEPGAFPVYEADADEDRNDLLRATAVDRVETMLMSVGLQLIHKPAEDGITPKASTALSRSVYQLTSMEAWKEKFSKPPEKTEYFDTWNRHGTKGAVYTCYERGTQLRIWKLGRETDQLHGPFKYTTPPTLAKGTRLTTDKMNEFTIGDDFLTSAAMQIPSRDGESGVQARALLVPLVGVMITLEFSRDTVKHTLHRGGGEVEAAKVVAYRVDGTFGTTFGAAHTVKPPRSTPFRVPSFHRSLFHGV